MNYKIQTHKYTSSVPFSAIACPGEAGPYNNKKLKWFCKYCATHNNKSCMATPSTKLTMPIEGCDTKV